MNCQLGGGPIEIIICSDNQSPQSTELFVMSPLEQRVIDCSESSIYQSLILSSPWPAASLVVDP